VLWNELSILVHVVHRSALLILIHLVLRYTLLVIFVHGALLILGHFAPRRTKLVVMGDGGELVGVQTKETESLGKNLHRDHDVTSPQSAL